LPIANHKADTKFDRLVIAQDTGSAIVGPARADIYFGAGDEAARIAGRIKHAGEFVMLIPHELDPVAAGRDTPLPPERPSGVSMSLTTMDDPTAVDPPAEVTQPAAKPAAAVTPTAAPSLHPNGRTRRKK
jgi:membrane-bound lytic murein transglycosylase A